jgi:hypothetical protein
LWELLEPPLQKPPGKESLAYLRKTLGAQPVRSHPPPGRARAQGEGQMSDRAETQHDQLDKIASKLLETASKLPPGAERHDFLKEIEKILSQLYKLKAEGK